MRSHAARFVFEAQVGARANPASNKRKASVNSELRATRCTLLNGRTDDRLWKIIASGAAWGIGMSAAGNYGSAHGSACFALLLWLMSLSTPCWSQESGYDGPTFNKGLWLFQRSTEYVTRHWLLPNARRITAAPAVVRCVDPTEAMIETFRPVSIGACHPRLPTKQKNTFVFAKRCDYLGPVKTILDVLSRTEYRETNEMLVGAAHRRDVVVARRIGDCEPVPELGNANLQSTGFSSSGAERWTVDSIQEMSSPIQNEH
jgi:hypothetical protein